MKEKKGEVFQLQTNQRNEWNRVYTGSVRENRENGGKTWILPATNSSFDKTRRVEMKRKHASSVISRRLVCNRQFLGQFRVTV